MKKLIAGNWKMNLTRDTVNQLAYDLLLGLPADASETVEYLVCPPFVYLDRITKFFHGSPVSVGAQDCSPFDNGAYTGDVSAAMLVDMGVSYVVLGHSERRTIHKETDELVNHKARKAHEKGLKTIICVGETEQERNSGREKEVVKRQILDSLPPLAREDNTVIAYEPVWAIGTGKTATPADASDMHNFIRGLLSERFETPANVRILYGGSMNADNAMALLSTENVDGGLIGGASLRADSFISIAQSV